MEATNRFSTLFVVAHPYLEKSRANRAVTETVADIPGLTVRRLYDLYPYFQIDVKREQELLAAHDLLVIQHPFYWYSMPPLLKQWLDDVWISGWAYGPGGESLRGKHFMLSLTAGGLQEAYGSAGQNRFSIEELLAPWNQTVCLCKMHWHAPRVLHGSIRAPVETLREHASHIRADLVTFAATGVLQ